jgi:hypothetical protein
MVEKEGISDSGVIESNILLGISRLEREARKKDVSVDKTRIRVRFNERILRAFFFFF